MVDVEKIKEAVQKGISILKDKGIPYAIEVIRESMLQYSDEVTVDRTKHKFDFPDCSDVIRFEYRGNFYELFFYADEPNTLTLMMNGEAVFVAEHGWDTFRGETHVKILKLGRWVDDLPVVAEKEQDALIKAMQDEIRERYGTKPEKVQAWATEISKNLDLGDYE